ncbi:hypothetical protein KEF85_01515 [Methylomonas paludis]|uniref:Uncharacterized protein n=1 Tax=Methylomonas paludis TaxID=1173101 RepID=A0A975MNT2_9GAMM|nr:hypothetical protein [Methylomonas paludis]QWF71202.1 hypothetical protein KEF85_01515 [Methylomonas paludis]
MAINPIWKNRETYTYLELTYLACDLEPENKNHACTNSTHLLNRMYSDILNFLNKKKLEKENPFPYTPNFRIYEADDSFNRYKEKLDYSVNKEYAIEIIDALGVKNFLRDNLDIPIHNNRVVTPSYLDTSHPMHSKELKIAIDAWEAVLKCNPDRPNQGSRKKLIERWLEDSYPKSLDILSDEAKNRIATMLNPDKAGGAPSTP